jgi:hypothetical protein
MLTSVGPMREPVISTASIRVYLWHLTAVMGILLLLSSVA